MTVPIPQNADAVLQADAEALARSKRRAPMQGASPPPEAAEEAIGRPRLKAAASVPMPVPETDQMVGLALSGGGIRSATFALGVLQRLAVRDHLRRVDVLSTVSGGGYIGAWLSAWIKRSTFEDVNEKLKQCPENHAIEPPQVQWLRRYSNYLTPRVGALSLDALTVAATYVRNVLLNITTLSAVVCVAVLIPILLVYPTKELLQHPALAGSIAAVFGGIALVFTAMQLWLALSGGRPSWARSPVVYSTVGAPVFLFAYFASAWLAISEASHGLLISAIGTAVAIALVSIGKAIAKGVAKSPAQGKDKPDQSDAPLVSGYSPLEYLLATAISVMAGFSMLYGLAHLGHHVTFVGDAKAATWILIAGPPLVVCVVSLAVTLWIGLMGRAYPEMYREWWSRVGGALIAGCAAWVAWCVLAIVVPIHLRDWLASAGNWTRGTIAAGWFASLGSVIGLVKSFSGSSTASKTLPPLAKLAAILATFVLVALAVAVACGTHALLGVIDGDTTKPFYGVVGQWTFAKTVTPADASWIHGIPAAWLLLTAGFLVAVVFGWRIDINRFSLHDMYKNRLIRCYLGASNEQRKPNRFTGFDPADDIALADLAPFVATSDPDEPLHAQPQRPFHVFNTALNLVHGSELSWQERKSALFVLTPTFCGFNLAPSSGDKPLFGTAAADSSGNQREQAFRPTAFYADNASKKEQADYVTHASSPLPTKLKSSERDGFTLGMALATSGAAVSPNMGANSQPALAMLMTIFNIRLGRWCPNPARNYWRRASPHTNLAWLIAEATGNTNERSDFVYLSDGGHFENTAVYELVRRRCSHIIMVDCGADAGRAFEDLGNLIRKCRVDLGAEIKLQLDDLYARPSGRCTAGFTTGSVTYSTGATGRSEGKILLIKPSLVEPMVEPADIYNYARGDSTFPQQTTLDQWFDESQFESYRFLGSALAEAAFAKHEDFFD